MPGFRSFKTFMADDGERVSIIEFESESEAAQRAWHDHPDHRLAQELGVEKYYAEFHIQVCTPVRSYGFPG